MASAIYNGAASYGTFMAMVGVVVAVIAYICSSSFASSMGSMAMSFENYKSVVGKVTAEKTCETTNNGNGSKSTSCSMEVEYTVNGKTYSNQRLSVSDVSAQGALKKDSDITIWYNPSDPGANAQLSSPMELKGGAAAGATIMLSSGLCVILIACLNLVLVQKYKFYAAASGVSSFFRR